MNKKKQKRLYRSRNPDEEEVKLSEKLHTTRGGEEKLKEKHADLTINRGESQKDSVKKRRRRQSRLIHEEESKDSIVDEIKPKEKSLQNKAQKKQKYSFSEDSAVKVQSKLRFEDGKIPKTKDNHPIAGSVVSGAIHRKISEYEDENAAVEGAHRTEEAGETAYRIGKTGKTKFTNHRAKKIQKQARKTELKAGKKQQFDLDENLHKNNLLKKQIQKQRLKKEYAKAAREKQAAGTATKGSIDYIKKVGGKITDFFKENKKVLAIIAVIFMFLMLIMTSVSSCSAMFMNSAVNYASFSYMSSDDAICQADLYYTQLEAQLQEQINQMEVDNPGYDSYRYNVGPIEHDPFILISYLSAKYGEFTFDDVKDELDRLFQEQYSLTTDESQEVITETKRVRVGESLGVVTTSGYCSCPICCGQWSGGPTASGVMPTANHTIAVDARNPFVPMGTKVIMNGIEYTVEDTGAFARYGVQFDVYYDNHLTALLHGHQNWEAFIADDNGTNEVEVTTTKEMKILNVTVQSKSLSAICQNRLSGEEKDFFEGYNEAKGNLQMFASPFTFRWYSRISSYYGYRVHPISGANEIHHGLDIGASEGTEIMAGLTGTVLESAYNDGYGNYVILQNEYGYEIRYAHMQSRSVATGDSVTIRDIIGTVGSTGISTGPHLHLELLKNGERLNPIFYFETGTESAFGGSEFCSEEAEKLLSEAEKHLGTPYVWGGYAPGGFDCSGFVSYCLTHSGVRNTGRLTAQGLYDICTPISESEMQPGDLVFFTGTYNAGVPVTHIGIYAGDGQMIHCGNPVQYTSIHSAYWQNHWYGAGRW